MIVRCVSYGRSLQQQVVENFDSMGLKDELLRGVYAYGFERPSAVQQRAVKPITSGRDVIAQSQVLLSVHAKYCFPLVLSVTRTVNRRYGAPVKPITISREGCTVYTSRKSKVILSHLVLSHASYYRIILLSFFPLGWSFLILSFLILFSREPVRRRCSPWASCRCWTPRLPTHRRWSCPPRVSWRSKRRRCVCACVYACVCACVLSFVRS